MDNSTSNLPPLSRLKPFEAAARCESFSLAAEELGLTQTAVSKQIALLEAELGLALFERRNRAVFLTEGGRRLGQVVGSALSEIAAEIAVLRGKRRGGELVLHCQLCEAFYWLMPRLSRFHQQNPGIELRVVSAQKPLTHASGVFDVAIQTSGRASGSARLAFTAADEVFPVCAPTLVEQANRPVEPVSLVSYPLLTHVVVPQDWMTWPEWFKGVGASMPVKPRFVEFDSYPLALQAAVAGQGIALGWRRTTEGMISEGKLVRPCAQFVSRPTEISVYRATGRDEHKSTERLLDWLENELT